MVPFYYRDILPVFLLIFFRVLGLTISSPIFSSTLVPREFILTMVFFVSSAVFYLVTGKGYPKIPSDFYSFFLMILNEFAIGISIGLFVNIIFTAFQLAAQFFSFQMGLGISEVLDPLSEIESPVVGQLYNLLSTLIFVTMNGLEYLTMVIYRSFDYISFIDISKKIPDMLQFGKNLFSTYFMIALQIAIPIMIVLLLVNIVLGIISKFAPRINVFSIGLDIDVVVGFLLIFMYLPFFFSITQNIFKNLFENIIEWMKILG
jgi:flagellar biosynthetic protein FliR